MNLQTLLTAIQAANELLSFIEKARADLKQSSEMTPEQEAVLDAKIDALQSHPWWQSGS